MIMRRTKDRLKGRYIEDQITKRHGTGASAFRRASVSYLKRVSVLFLSFLLMITFDSSIMEVFMVRAEGENNLKCVITAFSPLPQEIAEQTAGAGTPLEELLFPDSLEAVCTYEEEQENTSGTEDGKPEKPEEGDKASEKPEEDDKASEKPAEDDKSEKPNEDDKKPEEPDGSDGTLEKTGGSGEASEKPDGSDGSSKPPGVSDEIREKPDGNDESSKTTGESGELSEKSDGNDGSDSQLSEPTDEIDSQPVVYADKIDEMFKTAKDKMFSFLNGPIIEETQVSMPSNLSEREQESEVHELTNIVNIAPVSWECIYEYDSETPGCYIFIPRLPEDFLLSDGIILPEIMVLIVDEEEENIAIKNKKFSMQAESVNQGSCGNSLTWKYDNGTLTISGTGSMDAFDKNGTPWNDYEDMIRAVKITNGVTNIGSYAFFDCALLDSVELPGSVASIGTSAFHGCTSLGSVTIPKGVTSIGNLAFYGCSSLNSLVISNTVTSIGNLAFNGCSSLKGIEIPASVKEVTAYAFRNCSNALLYYPASLTDLDTVKETKANIRYASVSGGGYTELAIMRLGSDISTIRFPASVGGGTVWAANWSAYPLVAITHDSYPDHRYVDGVCAICGAQTAPEIKIDYVNERLVGFDKGAAYVIDGENFSFPADAEAVLSIEEQQWFGQTISIAKLGAAQTPGKAKVLTVPRRPDPPEVDKEDVSVKGGRGKLTNVKAGMMYRMESDPDSRGIPITGTTVENLLPGTYYVWIAAVPEQAFRSWETEVTIEEYELVPEDKPRADIDYKNEWLTGLVSGGSYHIGINNHVGSDMQARSGGTIGLMNDWFGETISIVKKGDGNSTGDSAEQLLKIPLRPSAPANTGKTDVTEGGSGGALTGVSSAMEYRRQGDAGWTGITGSTVEGLQPGNYEIRYKAKAEEGQLKQFASEIVTQTIASASLTQEKKPSAKIDYKKEKLTGLKVDEAYEINGDISFAESDGTIELEEEWIGSTISIVKVGDHIMTSDSDEQSLVIPPRPDPPEGVEAKPVSAIGAADGKLINVNSTMEYCGEDDELWKPVTGKEVTKLAPGNYIVCIKATEKSFCSMGVELTVQDAELKVETTPKAKIDYEKEKLTGLVAGGSYSISSPIEDYIINAAKDGGADIKEEWMGGRFYIKKLGDYIYTEDSEAQLLAIPERPSAPEGITTDNESKQGAKDGKIKKVDKTMQYRKEEDEDSKWKSVTGTEVNKLSAGAYLVRYKAVSGTNGRFASYSERCEIAAYALEAEPTPEAEISYADECFISLTPDASYMISGVKEQADGNGEILIRSAWMGKSVTIVRIGNRLTTTDSAKQSIFVPKRGAAPSGVKAVSESEKDKNDGKLTGVNSDMEYCNADVREWMRIDGDEVEDLAPGNYKIRNTYGIASFTSLAVTKTIYAYGTKPQEPGTNNGSGEADESRDQDESDGGQSSSQSEGTAGNDSSETGPAQKPPADQSDTGLTDESLTKTGTEADAEIKKNKQINGVKGNKSNKGDKAKKEVNGKNNTDSTDSKEHAGNKENVDSKAQADNKGGINGQNSITDNENNTKAVNGDEAADMKEGSAGSSQAGIGNDDEAAPDWRNQDGSGTVYTDRTVGRLAGFYDFILRLSDSRNLIWIAVILAEPIIFLLLLIYALNRKKRDKECQAEN